MTRKKKETSTNEFTVKVKKEKVEIPDPVLPSRDRVLFDSAQKYWLRVREDKTVAGTGDFLSALGLIEHPVTAEECATIGMFLVNFTDIFNEERILKSFYSWVRVYLKPVLVAWGITSISATEWARTPIECREFFRFMVAWGYGMFKHPDNVNPIPKRVLDKVKEVGLDAW